MSRQYYEPNPNYWVSKEAHDELKDENARLKAEVEMWKLRSDNWQKFCELTRPEMTDEVTRLKAEVERLNTGIQPEGSNDAVGRAVNVLLEKEKENARLKAEVERLKRGGDCIIKTACRYLSPFHAPQVLREWHETKQGGQP